MPIYEYQCSSCQNVIEVTQSITEEPLSSCPDCSGTLKKLISMSAFHLKGRGWYTDGYSNNSSNPGKAPAKPESEGKKNSNGNSKSDKTKAEKDTSSSKKEHNASSNESKAAANL